MGSPETRDQTPKKMPIHKTRKHFRCLLFLRMRHQSSSSNNNSCNITSNINSVTVPAVAAAERSSSRATERSVFKSPIVRCQLWR